MMGFRRKSVNQSLEMKVILQRVADGDGSSVMSELNRMTYPRQEAPTAEVITCVDFAARVFEMRETRRKREEQAAAQINPEKGRYDMG